MLDLSLYLVTDRGLAKGRSLTDIVGQAVKGGVTCVQLREKNCSTREFIAQGKALRTVLHTTAVPLIINDRVDIALVVGAQGVHLGQKDMSILDARNLAPHLIIGVSVENVDQALKAQAQGADYIGISPVFLTPTKTDTAQALGLAGITAIRQAVTLPMVGIGGIDAHNAAQVVQAGCDGIAVVSALMAAHNPFQAAQELKNIVHLAKEKS